MVLRQGEADPLRKMEFREKVRDTRQPVVVFEMIPPLRGAGPSAVRKRVEQLQPLVADLGIDAVNLPEIRDENRSGPRSSHFRRRMEPRIFGRSVGEAFRKERLEVLVNRCVVYTHWRNQQRWLVRSWKEFGVRNLIIVGGESSQVRYPGPSVTEAAALVTGLLNRGYKRGSDGRRRPLEVATDLYCGGITIPTRRRAGSVWDEPHRLVEKAEHGLEFFTSQVIYEGESTKRLLADYEAACQKRGTRPRRILLSFAPISEERDVAFLQWLGVEIPEEVRRYILGTDSGATSRSIDVAGRVLEGILEFVDERGITVPLGLNVEYILVRNFEVSLEMVESLSRILARRRGTAA